jgi:chemotaxis protein MotB
MKKYIFISFLTAVAFTSCVPSKQYEEMKGKYRKCDEENTTLRSENQNLTTLKTEQETKINDLEKRIKALSADTTVQGNSIRQMTKNYDKLNETYDLLLSKNKELLAGNVEENKKLIGSLQSTQEQLQRKEDELKKLADELEARKKNLDALKVDLDFSKQELQKREARLAELENILKQKDQAVLDLKRKVQDALLGFENKGLTITQKNGKIYVSLDESLLFASGSTKVEEKGVEALKKLAKVLEQNNDINVLVEGHTDDVPMAGKGDIKDNWDLSVMRATSIVKIITSNSKIDPTRLTAAGRGEYFPIDNAKTPEARKKNRRTEIILTPKLDELLKVLETN